MPSTFEKLNLKDQVDILVLNAPASFEVETAKLEAVRVLRSAATASQFDFILAFGTTLAQVQEFAHIVAERTQGDAIVWFAYPKGSSKKYTCEFNRDTGWAALAEAGFRPVRQVAIDEDWSALRFRRTEYSQRLK